MTEEMLTPPTEKIPTQPPPPDESETNDPIINVLLDRMIPFDAEVSDRRMQALKNQDRLTVRANFHYMAKGKFASKRGFAWDNIRQSVDSEIDSFRVRTKEDLWTIVGKGRCEIVGAVIIENLMEQITHRQKTDEEIVAERQNVILLSFGDPDPEHALLVRPGGFSFSEIQDGTVIMVRSKPGAGVLSVGITYCPG